MSTTITAEPKLGRTMRLKQNTQEAHERLDQCIMASEPFRDRTRFSRFVAVQYYFNRDIHQLYNSEALRSILPDLQQRRRLGLIEQDLRDLEIAVPPGSLSGVGFPSPLDVPTALGWLYVSEGSNLGAAILSREAVKLGLSDCFGARHLAAHPEGRGAHWQGFTMALDALELSKEEDRRVVEGAIAAFGRVQSLAETVFV